MSRRKVITIASIMAAVIVLVVVGVWAYVCHETWDTYQTALTQEKTTYAAMQKHEEELAAVFVDEKTCTSNVLEDDKTVCADAVQLLATVRDTKPAAVQKLAHHVIDLPSHISLVKTKTGKHEKQEQEIKNVDTKITTHIQVLQDAFLAKATSDYEAQVEAVKTSITVLSQLVTDTEGKVLDNATRDAASQAVKDAQAVLDEKIDLTKLDSVREQLEKLITQATMLSEKSAAVTSSRDAWQAEQDRIAQQAASARRVSKSSGYSSRSSSGESPASTHDPTAEFLGWVKAYEEAHPDEDRDTPLPEGFIPYG